MTMIFSSTFSLMISHGAGFLLLETLPNVEVVRLMLEFRENVRKFDVRMRRKTGDGRKKREGNRRHMANVF